MHEQCSRALLQDPQTPLFSNFFIKNGSHDTIHIFKNYFAIVFSIFNFSKISSIQFQQNYFAIVFCNLYDKYHEHDQDDDPLAFDPYDGYPSGYDTD